MKLTLVSVFAAAALNTATAIATPAEVAELDAPMSGVTLHEGGISMSVYYLDRDDTLEIVLTYDIDATPYEPERIRLNLDEGQQARLSLPGQAQVVYSLSRQGEGLQIEAEPTRPRVTLSE